MRPTVWNHGGRGLGFAGTRAIQTPRSGDYLTPDLGPRYAVGKGYGDQRATEVAVLSDWIRRFVVGSWLLDGSGFCGGQLGLCWGDAMEYEERLERDRD